MINNLQKMQPIHSFEHLPIIGILRDFSLETLADILPLYVQAGLTTIEITMNSANATALINYAQQTYGDQLYIGAGTVCDLHTLEQCLNAGAQFVVMPIVEQQVIKQCVSDKIPVFPGAFTPTEIYQAWNYGATMVKLFPASMLGADYIKDVLSPLSHIKLLATGGITLNNIEAYINAGANGFGIGSPLFVKSLIESKNWDALRLHFQSFKHIIDKIKSP